MRERVPAAETALKGRSLRPGGGLRNLPQQEQRRETGKPAKPRKRYSRAGNALTHAAHRFMAVSLHAAPQSLRPIWQAARDTWRKTAAAFRLVAGLISFSTTDCSFSSSRSIRVRIPRICPQQPSTVRTIRVSRLRANSGYYRHAKISRQGDDVPLPIRWRYKLDRWRSQLAGMFRSEPKQMRPTALPSLRHAGRRNSNQVPSVRREHDVLLRRSQQVAQPLDAANLSGDVCHAYDLLRDVRPGDHHHDASCRDSAHRSGGLMNLGGIATQVNFRLGASLPLPYNLEQPWRLVTAIFLHGGLLHIGFNMWVLMDIGPMVEELYGSARYLFLVRCNRRGRICGQFRDGTLQRRRFGRVARPDRRAARGDNWPEEPRGAGPPQRLDSLADLYCCPRLHYERHRQLRARRRACLGLSARPMMADRTPSDVTERRRADLLGWVAGIAVAVCFGFMVWNYLQNA